MKKTIMAFLLIAALVLTSCSIASEIIETKPNDPSATSPLAGVLPDILGTQKPDSTVTAQATDSSGEDKTDSLKKNETQATKEPLATSAPTKAPAATEEPVQVPEPETTPFPYQNYLTVCKGRLLVPIPETWKDQYVVEDNGTSVSFYSKENYENEWGGFLFGFVFTDFTSEDEVYFPSYEVICKYEGEKLLIADFPTDVQFNYENEAASAAYNQMYDQFDLVKNSLIINTEPVTTLYLCNGRATVEYQPEWEDHTVLTYTDDTFGVYSQMSFPEWGGHVFTVWFTNETEDNDMLAPHYDVIGSKDGKLVVAVYPSDVNFNYEDPDCTAEYQMLWKTAETIATQKITIR